MTMVLFFVSLLCLGAGIWLIWHGRRRISERISGQNYEKATHRHGEVAHHKAKEEAAAKAKEQAGQADPAKLIKGGVALVLLAVTFALSGMTISLFFSRAEQFAMVERRYEEVRLIVLGEACKKALKDLHPRVLLVHTRQLKLPKEKARFDVLQKALMEGLGPGARITSVAVQTFAAGRTDSSLTAEQLKALLDQAPGANLVVMLLPPPAAEELMAMDLFTAPKDSSTYKPLPLFAFDQPPAGPYYDFIASGRVCAFTDLHPKVLLQPIDAAAAARQDPESLQGSPSEIFSRRYILITSLNREVIFNALPSLPYAKRPGRNQN